MIERIKSLCVAMCMVSTANGCPVPGPMTDAIALVTASHPQLVITRDVHQVSAFSDWSANVHVGYAYQSTGDQVGDSETDGVNAGIRLDIPLFSKGNDASSVARHEIVKAELSIIDLFLREIESMCELVSQTNRGETMREFVRDRVDWRRKRVDEGMEEPEVLWVEAKAVQDTDYTWVTGSDKLQTLIQTTARRYGGERWEVLQEQLQLAMQ